MPALLTSYCGLECSTCTIYLATLEKNADQQREMRSSIADLLNLQFGLKLEPDDITDCDGCSSESQRLFSGCLNCEVRKCAISRKIKGCGFCPDYICPTLSRHFLLVPEAKKALEVIRKIL